MADAATWTALAKRCRNATAPNQEIDKAISIAAYDCPSLTPITGSFDAVRQLLNHLLPDHWFTIDSPRPWRPDSHLAIAIVGKDAFALQEERAATIEYATLAAMFEILAVNATD